jgi:hypothetical protein
VVDPNVESPDKRKQHQFMKTNLEYILTNSYKSAMIAYLKSHPEDFEEAIKLALTNKQPYSWRAAWLLWSCMDKNDKRIQGYTNRIIDILPTTYDNQQRELLMILQRMELNDANEGKLFDICVSIWAMTAKQPSVRCNAFKLMVKILKRNPGLKNEILLLTESQYMDSLSVGVKRSIFSMMAGLKI